MVNVWSLFTTCWICRPTVELLLASKVDVWMQGWKWGKVPIWTFVTSRRSLLGGVDARPNILVTFLVIVALA